MNNHELPPGFELDTMQEDETPPAPQPPRQKPVERPTAPRAAPVQQDAPEVQESNPDAPTRRRTVWDQPRQVRDNRQVADVTLGDVFDGETGYTVENDEKRAAIGVELGTLLVEGKSDEEIKRFLAEKGIHNVSNLEEIFAYRRTPEFAEWKRQNPGVPYPLDDTFDDVYIPQSAAGEALSYLSNSDLGAGLIGVSDGLTFGMNDELAGAVEATVDTVVDGGEWRENFDRNVDDYRDAQRMVGDASPNSYVAGNVVGSIASSIPVARAIGTTGQISARALAAEGGIIGGMHGAGNAEGGIPERIAGSLEGAAIGGAFGAVGGAVAGKFVRGGQRADDAADTIRTVDRLNEQHGLQGGQRVQPLPAQVGGKGTKLAQGVSDSTIFGAAALSRANDKFAQNSGRLLDRMAGASDEVVETVEDAASRIARSGDETNFASLPTRLDERVDRLYTKAREIAGDVELSTPKTVALLDNEIDRLLARPGKVDNLDDLVQFRDSLRNGKFTVDVLREERSAFGRLLNAKDSAQRSIAKRVWASLTDDINNGLRSNGLENAASAFRRADAAYAKSKQHTELVESILKGSEENIANRLVSMSRGDGKRLHDAMRLMGTEEAALVRQSIISGLGRKGDETFSPSTFITNWKKLSQNGKAALFQGQHRSDIDAFADLMDRAVKSGQFNNTSQTARNAMAISMIRQLLGNAGTVGASALATGGGTVATGVASVGGSAILAALLSSPKVARAMVWIGKSGRTRAQVTDYLTRFAIRNPELAEQVEILQGAADAVTEEMPVQEQAMDELPQGFEVDELPEGFDLNE